MSKIKFSPILFITIIILALSLAIAFYMRVVLPYDQIFVGDWIKFSSADAYYHMHLVDNLAHNFPHHMSIDPYLIYPRDPGEISIRFFVWLLAGTSWIIGLGSPTQHIIDVVSVYLPAILGALTVIPVYFIGKELFGRWAGAFSAVLLAILPGEFMGRSILGFTDYHIAETLFTTVTMLFVILAIKAANQRQLTFSHLKHRDWTAIRKSFIYSLLAGIFLGIYIFTWQGALLFVFITFVYFVIQFIIDHLKHKSTDYLCFVSVIFFSVALIISTITSSSRLYVTSLIIALLIPLVLSGVSRFMASKKIKPTYYPLILFGLGLAGLGFFYLISPSLLSSMVNSFLVLIPSGAQLTTIEMQPLIRSFIGNGFWNALSNSYVLVWGNFTTGFLLSFISLCILIYLVIKHGSADKAILVVWSLVILAANLLQRRFGYYFAVNVALLTGYLSWRIMELAGLRELAAKAAGTAKGVVSRKARPQKGGLSITINHTVMALALLIVFFVAFFWNIQPAIGTASVARFAPSDAWVSSLHWLKENTPEPFGDPDAYYRLHKLPPPGERYKYPESAYGVLAWWDYGYWITRIAHRIPNANPSQNPKALTNVASFFASQDEKSASEIAQELGSAYIVIDHETALSKFWAIATWAGRTQTEYFDIYLVPQENRLVARTLYYPEYYRSVAARLYNFDGKTVTPESLWVISYREDADNAGTLYKIITSAEQFDTYEDAEAYISSQESTNYRIVSMDPMISPVPLEALEHYKLIHSSDNKVSLSGEREVPAVKIFEYID
ncbi:oligosaccharyl transferase, archaeosortase A system-associated [Chloroflexota bacterium]